MKKKFVPSIKTMSSSPSFINPHVIAFLLTGSSHVQMCKKVLLVTARKQTSHLLPHIEISSLTFR